MKRVSLKQTTLTPPPKEKVLIPGGKELAKYVAYTAALSWRTFYQPLLDHQEEQRAITTASLGRDWRSDKTVDVCRGCGFLKATAKLSGCKSRHAYNLYCASCLKDGVCPQCRTPCGYRRRCRTLVWKSASRQKCAMCNKMVCSDHLEYCRHCAEPLCLNDGEGGIIRCALQHTCARGKKRERPEERNEEGL